MRVVAGKYRSRVLKSLRGLALRPTSDRLRETLFNILGPAVQGCVFVDVYAGTGAVGIEAISRGARRAIFIENHAAAANLTRQNLESLGIEANHEILEMDALRALETLETRRLRAQFFFLDPPYARAEEYERALSFLGSSLMLTPGGRVIVEHQKRRPLPEQIEALECIRVVEQGDTALSFYRLALAA